MHNNHRRTALTFRGMQRNIRYGFLVGLVLLLGFATGCSDDDDPPEAVATFTASTTGAPTPNGVRLEGTTVSNAVVNVQVVIDGSSTSAGLDLYSFAFDILLSNPGVVQFVQMSEMEGDVLVPTPPDQDVEAVVSQQGDRVIVGVSKTGGGAGNGFPEEERTIVSMDFTVSSGSTTLTFASTPAMKGPAALDSSTPAVPIMDITFDAESATISR